MNEDARGARVATVAPVRELPLTPEGAAAACQLATMLGLDPARIDLAGCRDKDELLTQVAAMLDFPDWFGGNWDAYFDCLADLSWRPARGYLLVFENTRLMREFAPEVLDTSIAILEDASKAWAERGVTFLALVDDATLSG